MPHLPVLLRETTNLLSLKPGDYAVDCTFGDGGHARIILERLTPSSESRKREIHFLGIDDDPENIGRAKKNQEFVGAVLVNDNFKNLKKIVEKHNFVPVNAILLDLGWSRTQFEASGRGFSFLKDEPLDMRYDTRISRESNANNLRILTAAKIVNTWTEAEIGRILREYSEERHWKEIARAIVQYRKKQPVKTTKELIRIIQSSSASWRIIIHNSRLHPATKTFQALRIAVNDELNNLRQVLPQAVEILAPSGRLAVISFHSLEDRIVKRFFQEQARQGILKFITKKPIVPGRAELKENPASHSAKLRVAEKI